MPTRLPTPDNTLLVASFYQPVDPLSTALWDISNKATPKVVARFSASKPQFAADGTLWRGGGHLFVFRWQPEIPPFDKDV